MSVDGYNVKCTGCRYDGAIGHSPVRLEYVMPGGEAVCGYRVFAWCHRCQDIVDAEELLDPGSIRAQLSAYSRTKRGVMYKLRTKIFGEKDDDAEKIKELQGKLWLSSLRKSGPRCLNCGETTIVPLLFDSSGVSNILHACGGRLYKVPEHDDPSESGFSYGLRVIKLDTNGKRIPGGEEIL